MVLLLALPAFLFLLSDHWYYSGYGHVLDAWVYFGYFQNYSELIETFHNTYYGTRLSVIFPGYLAYSCLPPLVANVVLRLALFYVTVFSLHSVIARTINQRAALLTGVLASCYGILVNAVGWDYVDGFGIAYLSLTLYLLTTASRPRENRAMAISCLLASGVSLAAFVFSNTFYAVLIPLVCAHYAYCKTKFDSRRQRFWFWRDASFVFIGGLLVTFLCGVVNRCCGGQFWFFWPSVKWLLANAKGERFYLQPWSVWVPFAFWLVIPSLVAATAVLFLVVRKARPARDTTAAFFYQGLYLAAFALWWALDWRCDIVMQYWYYSSLLTPFVVLAIGGQIGTLTDRLNAREFAWMVVITTVAALGGWAVGENVTLPRIPACFTMLVFAGGAVLVVLSVPKHFVRMAGLVGIFCILNPLCGVRQQNQLRQVGVKVIVRKSAHISTSEKLKTIYDSSKFVREQCAASNLRFWYDREEAPGELYTAISSMYLYGYRQVAHPFFPNRGFVWDKSQSGIQHESKVALLSAKPDAIELAHKSFNESGLQGQLVSQTDVGKGDIAFSIFVFDVQDQEIVQAAKTLPLEGVVSMKDYAKANGLIEERGPVLAVVTSATQWDYAALFPIKTDALPPGRVLIRLEGRITRGHVNVGVVRKGGSDFVTEIKRVVRDGETTYDLVLDAPGECEAIVVRNGNGVGDSRLEISRLSVYLMPSSNRIVEKQSTAIIK